MSERDGQFKDAPALTKTGTGRWRTARFLVGDACFRNRVHNLDFRLHDRSDGAETVRRVEVRLLGNE